MAEKRRKRFNVDIEDFDRPETLEFISRIDSILNLSGISRRIPSCKSVQTMVSRVNRHTQLNHTVEQKAFAQDIGEMFNEAFYIIGVGLGHFAKDPHRKFKYFYTSDADRLKDKLDELEEIAEP